MSQVVLEIPEEAILALKVRESGIGEELKMAAAAKLLEIGRLSSGSAAKLAGMPRTLFLSKLADYGVETFRLSAEDLEKETRLA